MGTVFKTAGFELRPAERRLLVRGEPVALGARAFDLLLALIEHRDRVVPNCPSLAVAPRSGPIVWRRVRP